MEHANELVGIPYQATAGATPVSLAGFAYDAFGRMVAESENGVGSNFVYDGQNLLLVLDVDGQVVERELNGPAVDQVLASETVTPVTSGHEAAGTVNWLLTDRQGSVRDVARSARTATQPR